jgi:hypothetical protein
MVADAPFEQPAGGTVYFDATVGEAHLEATLLLMGVGRYEEYAAFLQHSPDLRSGYLTQLRVISPEALREVFRIDSADQRRVELVQPLDASALLRRFVQHYAERWRTRAYPGKDTHVAPGKNAYGESVGYETFDGLPGRNADEYLGFGFTVENAVFPIYRIWTRTWFAHK